MGIRTIIYIDDILIKEETSTLAKQQRVGMIFLLENLGFITNYSLSPEPYAGDGLSGFNSKVNNHWSKNYQKKKSGIFVQRLGNSWK